MSTKDNDHIFLNNRGINTNSFIANVNIVAKDIDTVRNIGQNIKELDDKVSSVLDSAAEASASADRATSAALEAQETANNAIVVINAVSNNAVDNINISTDTFTTEAEQLVARAEEAAHRAEIAADTADISQGISNLDGTWQTEIYLLSGSVLELPVYYLPNRSALRLTVNGLACYRKDSSNKDIFQYEEVGEPDVLSRHVKILFDVPIGTVFNAFVISNRTDSNDIGACIFDTATDSPTIVAIRNISAVVKKTVGVYEIFFDNTPSNGNYVVAGNVALADIGTGANVYSFQAYARTQVSFTISLVYASATAAGLVTSLDRRVSLNITRV